MKTTRSIGRNMAARRGLRKVVVFVVLYALVCLPTIRSSASETQPFGLPSSLTSPRQVAHFRVDRTFNSTGFTTDRYARANDSLAGAIELPDGKFLIGVVTDVWNGTSSLYFRGFDVARLNADGSKDLTFGKDCRVSATPGVFSGYWPTEAYRPRIAIQTDGKIIFPTSSTDIVRCNPDGTRDTSFGPNGVRSHNLFSPATLATQPDGKIVFAGTSGQNFAFGRLNADGTIDTSFDGDGVALISVASPVLESIAVEQGGKIVAAGSSANDFAVVRINSDGSADTSFDGDGKVATPIHSGNETANAVVVQPDGKIVAAGFSHNSASSSSGVFALVRYNVDGSLDTSFDGDGKVATPVVQTGEVLLASNIRSVALQADGKIVASGVTHNKLNFDHVVARYNADGSLDTTFGSGGFKLPPLPTVNDHTEESADIVLIRPDGRILVIGDTIYWNSRLGKDITLWMFNSDGSADNSFGTAGRSDVDVGAQRTVGTTVAIQPDGKILAGSSMPTGVTPFSAVSALARYNADGSRDMTFAAEGFVLINEPISRIAVGPTGKVLACGTINTTSDGACYRYNSDGTADSSFDGDGKVAVANLTTEGIEAAEFQPDGKILILNSGSTITRLNTDGSFDTSFDSDGRAVLSINPGTFKLLSDGKIIAAGGANSDFGIARLNGDGSLDTSFDGDGIASTDISGADRVTHVAIQPDGKIVAAGQYNFTNQTRAAFARYNSNGSLDTAFGTSGKTQFSNIVSIAALNLRPDGKIVAIDDGFSSSSLIRLNTSGLPDTAFYADGVGIFNNTKFGSPTPFKTTAVFDAQGRIVQVGYDRSSTVNNDVRSLFVGRIEIQDHPYVHFDHNGDGKADLAVFRPSNNRWYVLTPDSFRITEFGQAGDQPVPADYDGDGITDLAVFRPSGTWSIINSETGIESSRSTAGLSILPIPSDRDGDGYDDLAFFRNGLVNQLAHDVVFSESNTRLDGNFGVPGDKPIRGDFDGNGRADVALYRPSNQTWYIMSTSTSQGFYAVQWGAAGDIPVPADYDGDGRTDIAVWRPSTGRWWIMGSAAGLMNWTVWGEPTDEPVPADYDGDGKTDIAVWRPSTGTWYIINSSNSNIRAHQFGEEGDLPLPSSFIY